MTYGSPHGRRCLAMPGHVDRLRASRSLSSRNMEGNASRVFGEQAVRYILNRSDDSAPLTPQQVMTLNTLESLAERISNNADPFQRQRMLERIGARVDESKPSLASWLRQQCGGEVPTSQSDDPVVKSLSALASDWYAVFLLPSESEHLLSDEHDLGLSVLAHERSDFEHLLEIFRSDNFLRELFPRISSHGTGLPDFDVVDSHFALSWGSAGSVSLRLLPLQLLSYAWTMCALDCSPSLDCFLDQVEESVVKLRALASGEVVEYPYFVALTGFTVPDQSVIRLRQGVIRQVTMNQLRQHLADYLPDVGQGSLALLRLSVPVRITNRHPSPRGPSHDDPVWQKINSAWQRCRSALDDTITRARLALVLAAPVPESQIRPQVVFYKPLMPLRTFGSIQYASPSMAHWTALNADEIAGTENWSTLLDTPAFKHVKVGARRLLRAISDRTDPGDSLIDAIIAWESFFGTSVETSFRVTLAMAKLLEPESRERRRDLHKELKELYNTRSKLVHGRLDVGDDYEKISASRDLAIAHGMSTIRSLLLRPELLEIEDSANRSTSLILDLCSQIDGSDGEETNL